MLRSGPPGYTRRGGFIIFCLDPPKQASRWTSPRAFLGSDDLLVLDDAQALWPARSLKRAGRLRAFLFGFAATADGLDHVPGWRPVGARQVQRERASSVKTCVVLAPAYQAFATSQNGVTDELHIFWEV